jgi:Derlin-2/3
MAFQQEYFAIPPITRAYTTTCLLTTIAVVSEIFFFFIFNSHIIIPPCLIAQPARQFLLYLNYKAQLFIHNRIKKRGKEKIIDRCRHLSGVGA